MSGLIHCVYASKAAPDFREHDLPALLEKSRAANSRRHITGMLLHIDRSFFQVLEGDRAEVDGVYEQILADKRHSRVTRIIHEPIYERDFGDWTMGYARLDMTEVATQIGENDFFSARDCVEQMNPGRAKKLLQAFGSGRWRADQTGVHRVHSRMG